MVTLGLKANWKPFAWLVLVNALVGSMVGMERSILPAIAQKEFGMEAQTAILSFVVVFGLSKAFTNHLMGQLSKKYTRKTLLIWGWGIGLPVPFLLMYAPTWNWVIIANILLGMNQGLAWSSTVVMKIELAGEKNRGLAMGLNEFAGYLSVGLMAYLTAYIAEKYGLRPMPFYVGAFFAMLGILLSVFIVKDTQQYASLEAKESAIPLLKNIFWAISWQHPALSATTQAGFVNNLNDGMIWGLLPVYLTSLYFSIHDIGVIVAIYPLVWGISQIFTGKIADIFPKRTLLFIGMSMQGIAISLLVWASTKWQFWLLNIVLGLGTALVYPTFLAIIADYTHPSQRPQSLGTFRMWRDIGYAVGAVFSGIIADIFGIQAAIFLVGIITIISGTVAWIRIK